MASFVVTMIILITFRFLQSQAGIECTGERECQGSDASIKDDYVRCSGSSSCGSTPLIESSTDIDCTGRWSCTYSRLLAHGSVNCLGGWACQDSSKIRGDIIKCMGMGSCEDSGTVNANSLMLCNGWTSCKADDQTTDVAKLRVANRLNCDGSEGCSYWRGPLEIGIYIYIYYNVYISNLNM